MPEIDDIAAKIEEHRKKAVRLRRQADAEDAKADALRREAAKLSTMLLEPVQNPLKDGQTFPELAPIGPHSYCGVWATNCVQCGKPMSDPIHVA